MHTLIHNLRSAEFKFSPPTHQKNAKTLGPAPSRRRPQRQAVLALGWGSAPRHNPSGAFQARAVLLNPMFCSLHGTENFFWVFPKNAIYFGLKAINQTSFLRVPSGEGRASPHDEDTGKERPILMEPRTRIHSPSLTFADLSFSVWEAVRWIQQTPEHPLRNMAPNQRRQICGSHQRNRESK